MKRTLPPLGALVAFEAAARHLSFTRAGAELAVTQAAISHHIKTLEAHLGRQLFRRRPRALLLTDEGQRFHHAVAEALDRLESATREAGAAAGTTRLVVTLLPSFAARWLVPRLGRFYAAHPTVDLHVVATPTLLDLEKEGIDVAIRYGGGHYRGSVVEHLLDEELFPVCSPRLRQGRKRLRSPADLQAHTLLHEESDVDWRAWLEAAGVTTTPSRGTVFTDSSLLVQAAVAGQGVALGRSVLVRDELAAGRLVRPFPRVLPRWPSPRAYWVASPASRARRPEVAAFRAWLLAEARADRHSDARRRRRRRAIE
jgi:LysR family glycine cleavage system transcriptional activator